MIANIKTVKRCAFCKYWYDPMNSAIAPKIPKSCIWTFDEKASNKCLKRNYPMKAVQSCSLYESKMALFY